MEENWKLILATAEPVPMPAISATGTDIVRQFRAALWMAGHIVLSLDEIRSGLVDQCE
jgi:hypothetical protein